MKKKLIEADCIEDCICKTTGKVYADGSIILTAGAKDALSKRGVSIVYGPRPHAQSCPAGCTCPACAPGASGTVSAELERLILGVAAVLKTEYGVDDPAELQALSLQIVQTIKENI